MAVNSNALAMLRELNIRKARESLWAYCVITSPEFYKADRWHLWIYCEVLQALYERRLTKSFFLGLCRSPNVPKWYEKWYGEEVGFDRLKDNQNFTYLMTNMAPRMGKCIAKGSLVTMSDGTVKKIEDIKQGEYVESLNEKDFSVVSSKVLNNFDNGVKNTLKIKLYSGKEIVCTKNHPLYTINGWTMAENLNVGDKLICAKRTPLPYKTKLPFGYAKIMGYMVADGSYNGKYRMDFTKQDKEIVNDMKKCLQYHGWKLNLIESKKYHYNLSSGNRENYSPSNKTPNSELKPYLGIHGSWDKFVPDVIFESNSKDISDFIGAYFSCDGTVSEYRTGLIEFYSVSKKLLEQVQMLLTKFGIFSTLRRKKGKYQGKEHLSYRLIVIGEDVITFNEKINVVGEKKEKLIKLVERVKQHNHYAEYNSIPKEWKKELKRKDWYYRKNCHACIGKPFKIGTDKNTVLRVAKFENNQHLLKLCSDNIIWDRIVSIEDAGLQQTYDIEVENIHNFMVDNVIVHNSRTLVKFCDWILGKSNKNKIISVSYNDDLAEDSSRYVRDGILERKNLPMDIVFADVFPDATIKADNKSLKKWALDGCFFSYMGAGLNGTITGKGGNCLAEGTLIDTTQGKVSIEFIAENYKYINIFVKTFDTHDLHVKYSKVVNASMTFSREECTFITENGFSVTSTFEHRFYVTNIGSEYDVSDKKHYVQAKDLKIGDSVVINKNGKPVVEYICDIHMKTAKTKPFYDIMVDGENNNYFSNGILCHNCTIIDDPIKNDKEALNDTVLQGIWDWYTGTFLSRAEETDGGSINIINHTRWNTKDLCGRLLSDDDFKDLWFILAFPVEYNGEMLCEGILPKKKFEVLRKVTEKNVVSSCIFKANYYQHPIDIKGRLFTEFKTYNVLPEGIERFIAYCDTADTGDDYLCAIMGGVLNGEGYVTDVLFTKDPMIKTEKELPRLLVVNKITDALIESNSGGKNFARSVEKNLWELYKIRDCRIRWFHQSENKQSRILSGAPYVMEHIYFPTNWKDRFPEFYNHIITYQSTGKNEHDDGAEALVEFGKMIVGQNSVSSYIEWMKQLKEKRKH